MQTLEPSTQISDATSRALTGEEWQAAFDALPEAIFLFDETGRLSRANCAGALLRQTDEGSPEATRCCDMFWRAEGAEDCVVERSVASGEVVEVEMLGGPSADRPTLVTVLPIGGAEGAAAGRRLVIVRDVSDLRRAEAEAFEHKSFMASLADLAPDEIYTLDLEGRFTWMNERAEASNSLLSTSLIGRHFNDIVAVESRDEVSRNLARTLKGEDTECEAQTIRPDGTVRYVEAYTSALWREGNVTGMLVFLRDITERKRAQERMAQSDKLRAVGELAAGVAHNLNNALTVIQGRAQLLLMRSTDEATSKSLEVITRAVSDSAQTLRRMLDFARRGTTTDFGPVDLADLIASSVEIARPKWQSSSATRSGKIEVEVVNQGPVYVYGDAAELREVVLNMIFNAVDAMPEGGTIETGSRAEIDSACFWVADAGRGMPPEVVERIFEPFYTTKGERGTGLGLSASHGIVARHSGQIMVVSFPGEGTRFEVRLPLYEEARRAKQESAPSPAIKIDPARVLIVEDEERVRSLLAEAFQAAGHTVIQAWDGAEALKRLEQEEFELVISDIGLPEVSGLQVARWIKTNRPGLPVILATGWIEMITPADYEQGRIDAVFKKPYAVKEVMERACELLDAGRRESEPSC
ncbi:MAG TPA: PAS domain-containing protein [Pyrinomonadaceae bacterium]|nr:PAS domain-containing protein [Pyrinomonadaceae bacterium]